MSESAIFKAAVKLAPEQRAAYLEQACCADPDLRREVESLLRAHDAPGNFLQEPPDRTQATVACPPSTAEPGTVIGPYKLLQQIGEGGMGVVYMAEQQEPVRRQVALKIIKPGMDSRQVIARFEAERQALAMMDHQNIARVLDAGSTRQGDKETGRQGDKSIASISPSPSLPVSVSDLGRPYFVMELVHGIPITSYCDDHKLTPREQLQLFVPVCQAVQHAHQKGIIHRDLKPSNILVTMYDDKPVPKVIDFGVAKAVEQRLTEKTLFTQYGTMVGTFEYMSPEQADMNAFGVDTRSDIYSLGVLLYELLTGTTPLERQRLREAAFGEIVRLIKEEEPPRPSTRLSTSGAALAGISQQRGSAPDRLTRLVRGELDWIVMRCLEKDRARRYETANGLAHDVERYLKDEPVEACPPTTGYRLRKFARKNKRLLATTTAFAALLLLGMAASAWQAVRATEAEATALVNEQQASASAAQAKEKEQEAKKERDEAKRQRDEVKALNERLQAAQARLRTALYTTHINFAQLAWEADAIDRVQELLEKDRPGPEEADLRGFEWHYLSRLCPPPGQLVIQSPGFSIAYSPDGKRLVGIRIGNLKDPGDSVAKVWDAQTWQELFVLKGHTKAVRHTTFSPDGKRLATASDDETARVWDVQNGKELLVLKGHTKAVQIIVFSPDGKRLATASADNTVRVWDAQKGEELHTFKDLKRAKDLSFQLAFNPDGKHLAASSYELERLKEFTPSFSKVKNEGREFAVRREGPLWVWEVETGRELFNVKGVGATIAFSSDGKRLTACSEKNGVATVLDAQTGKELSSFTLGGKDGLLPLPPGRTNLVDAFAFSPDGKLLASGNSLGGAHPIRVWDVQTGKELLTLKVREGRFARPLFFSADGKRLVTSSGSGVRVLWDVPTGQMLHALKGTNSFSWAFSPDGKHLAASGSDGVRMWEIQALAFPEAALIAFSLSPDGKRLATALPSADQPDVVDVKVWDARTGQMLLPLKGLVGFARGGKARLTFSPDSSRLAAAASKMAKVWDAQTGEELVTIKGQQLAYAGIAFSPDGKRLALSGGTGNLNSVKLWDAQTGKELLTLKADKVLNKDTASDRDRAVARNQSVLSMAFSPDGTRLVGSCGVLTGSKLSQGLFGAPKGTPSNVEAIMWDARTGEQLLVPPKASGLVFSPDGKRLAGIGPGLGDPKVLVLDAQTGNKLLTLKGHTEAVESVVFSPDGQRLVSAPVRSAGQMKGWNALTGEELLTLHGQGPLAFTPDGHRLFGRAADGTIKIWDATPLPQTR